MMWILIFYVLLSTARASEYLRHRADEGGVPVEPERLLNVRRAAHPSESCGGFCTADGAWLGIFNMLGECVGRPTRYFQCIDGVETPFGLVGPRNEYHTAEDPFVCYDGWDVQNRDDFVCCADMPCRPRSDLLKIGSGSFGHVFLAHAEERDSASRSQITKRVALKMFAHNRRVMCVKDWTQNTNGYADYEVCANELLVARAQETPGRDLLRHVTPYKGKVQYDGNTYVAFAYMNGGTLYELMLSAAACKQQRDRKKSCTQSSLEAYNYVRTCAHEWMRQLVEAVEDLGRLGFVHRDLRMDNVLIRKREDAVDVCSSRTLYIGDFGAAVHLKHTDKPAGTAVREDDLTFVARMESDFEQFRREVLPRERIVGGGDSTYASSPFTSPPGDRSFFPVSFTDLWAVGVMLRDWTETTHIFEKCDDVMVGHVMKVRDALVPLACTFRHDMKDQNGFFFPSWHCPADGMFTKRMRGDAKGHFDFAWLYEQIKSMRGKCPSDTSAPVPDSDRRLGTHCVDCSKMIYVDHCADATGSVA